MSEEHLQIMREEIAKAVQKNVNGKIDAIDERFNAHIADEKSFHEEITQHMEEVKPFMQGFAGIQILWKFLVAIGALAIAYNAIRNGLK